MKSSPFILVGFAALAVAAVMFTSLTSVLAQGTNHVGQTSARQLSTSLGIPDSLDFEGYVGITAGGFPEYEGSDDVAAVAVPLADIRQEDFLFIRGATTNPNVGSGTIGWNALNLGFDETGKRKFDVSVGPLVRFFRGRDEDDSDVLKGLGDIDTSGGVGGFLETRAGDWYAYVSAVSRNAGEAGDGLLVMFRSGYTAQLSDQFVMIPGVYTSWGDDDYMQGFFGVSPTQSAQSGLAPFIAGSGFKDVGIRLRTNYEISRHVLISGEIGYQRLLGDAADSPIVDGPGSPNQYRALFGVAYKF